MPAIMSKDLNILGFLNMNKQELFWKFMKYYWIEFDAYKFAKHMHM
jgi:hypothetical protein